MQLNAGQPVSAFVKVCLSTCSKIEDDRSELSRIAHTMIIHFESIIVISFSSITGIRASAHERFFAAVVKQPQRPSIS